MWNEDAKIKQGREKFTEESARLWNRAPREIAEAETLTRAKQAIRKYCLNLPI